MKTINFLNKALEKRLCWCFPQHPQTKTINSFKFKWTNANFKSRYVSTSIDFSRCCELWPKRCVFAGSSGTHSVCVCTYHQNMKLLLAPLNVNYQELFALILCDVNNKECIVHRYPHSPESTILFTSRLVHSNAHSNMLLSVITYIEYL